MRKLIKQFFELESSSGIILFAMALISFIWANSSYQNSYTQWVDISLFWVNEVGMAIFFFLVGLELKRNYLEGYLSSFSQIALPAIGALGGMLIPALVYIIVNIHHPELIKGWSTPVATDIAFALGVLMLLGKRIPDGLKLFLLMLAIFDDIGAVIIIAIFYSHGFIHPTLIGFLLAMFVPGRAHVSTSMLYRLEKLLHPWVAYLIIPIFALANAGIILQGVSLTTVVWGVALGLLIGKQLGVFAFSWAMIKLGFAKLPDRSSWLQFYGVSILCGIGFTMSLFLGTLSFKYDDVAIIDQVRLGVIIGSLLSGLLGALVLVIAKEKAK